MKTELGQILINFSILIIFLANHGLRRESLRRDRESRASEPTVDSERSRDMMNSLVLALPKMIMKLLTQSRLSIQHLASLWKSIRSMIR